MKAVAEVKAMNWLDFKYSGKPIAVLLSGKAGVGKTFCAEKLSSLLLKHGYTSTIESFAYGVKQCAYNHFNWDSFYDDKGKLLLDDISRTGRAYNKNNWVRTTLNKIEDDLFLHDIYIIDDWNFINEREYIEKTGLYFVVAVWIESYTRGDSERSLELPWDITYYDLIIENNDEKDLEESLKLIINYIEKIEEKGE